ncbi:hypothetical protein VaNZ11_015972 [Volvox africanus]|uniref:Protein kinase domain-containing protein n=1 Tax=Volvox africanus TaxID=51714 RepID=A0ABQ5SN60_9CHLO|nr:hypothetical protein VaNZ11_015972 [Volvox africanus]
MSEAGCFAWRLELAVFIVVLVGIFLPLSTSQALDPNAPTGITGRVIGCSCRRLDKTKKRATSSICVLEGCNITLSNTSENLLLANLRAWLPDDILPPEDSAITLSNVTLIVPSCAPVWDLQADACTFRLAANWPNAGLQTGRGFIYFPRLVSAQSTTASRLNVTCPLEHWAALEAAATITTTTTTEEAGTAAQMPLQPCGTAIVTSTEELLAALSSLQAISARVLITLAANISLPVDAASGLNAAGNVTTDPPPLALIYRNVTLTGRGGLDTTTTGNVGSIGNSSSGSLQQQTEINLSSRLNSFRIQQQAVSASSSDDSAEQVVMTFADLSIVNVPPGPRFTWPAGILGSGMWHLDLDRSKDAPLQVIYLRLSFVLTPGQTRYLNYWYMRALSIIKEEVNSAAWLLDIVTPPVQILSADDGSTTQFGLTGTYLEKYNTTATPDPVLTVPTEPLVDLWSVNDPPASPTAMGLVASLDELVSELNTAWTGPRVIVLMANITLDAGTWPKDGFQMAAGLTLSGPSLMSNTPGAQVPTLDARGLQIARVPPGMTVSFRNLRLFNASVPISWALPGAPESLPGVPGYEAWHTRCMPGPLDGSAAKYEMHGCEVAVPPVIFFLLQIYNNLLCATSPGVPSDALRNCTSTGASAAAAAAAQFPYLPFQLDTFFDRLFHATGKYAVTQPDAERIFFRSNTLTSFYMNTTVFKIVQETRSFSGSGSDSPALNPNSNRPSLPATLPVSCSLQTLTTILSSAPRPVAAKATDRPVAPTEAKGPAPAQAAIIGGGIAGSVVAVVTVLAFSILIIQRLRRRRSANHLMVVDAEKAVTAGTLLTGGTADECGDTRGGSGSAAPASAGLTDWGFRRGPSTVTGASNVTATATDGEVVTGGSSMMRRTGGCLAVAAACRSALTLRNNGGADSHGGSDRAQSQAACYVHASAATAAASTASAEGPSPVVGIQLDVGVGTAVSGGGGGGDGHSCSAFSMSFAASEMAFGKAPTMLELLLGLRAGKAPEPQGLSPQPHQQQSQQTLRPGQTKIGMTTEAAVLAGGGGGGAAAAATAGAGKDYAGQVVGPGNDPDDDPNNYGDNNNSNRKPGGAPGNMNTTTRNNSLRGGTLVGSSPGASAQRALTGEIDGLIRYFEATSQNVSSPHSGQSSNRSRVLGSGGFGVVYKGEWRGLPVAIKVVLLQDGDSAIRRERLVREVALSATLSHPNIVPTYHYAIQPVTATGSACAFPGLLAGHRHRVTNKPEACDAAEASPTAATLEADGGVMAYKLSIFMAYCDRGTLRDALRTGAFRRPWPPPQLVSSAAVPSLLHGSKAGATSRRRTRHRDGSGAKKTLCGATSSSGDVAAAVSITAAWAAATPAAVAEESSSPPSSPPRLANLGVPHPLQPITPGNPGPMGHGARLLQQPLADAYKEELVAAAAAAGAVPRDADSSRSPRQFTGGGPGREGRLESWQDLRAAPNQALALFAALDVARGLNYLHARNVVHGDLSLQNILLTSTEPFFPEIAIMASSSTSTVLAAATAALALTGGDGNAAAAAAAAGGPSAGSQAAARVMHGVMNRLPEEPLSCSADEAAVQRRATATGAATAWTAGGDGDAGGSGAGGTSDGSIPPGNASFGARSVGDPRQPPPPSSAPKGSQSVMAIGTTLEAALLTSAERSTETANGDYDASAEDPEGMGGTISTNTRSGTIGGLSVGTDAATTTPWASLSGGGRQAFAMRLALVQPLLGQVFKISDFGLSVRLEGDETHRSGLHQGTPYYTATEVLLSGKVSPAADVYSYGVCLWCLVHGVSLCQLRHLLPPVFSPVAPTLLSHLAPELHPGLRSLLRRCMSGEAGRRPRAAGLVTELHGLVQAVLGPELAPLLLGAERREREAGRTVAGSLLLDSANGMGPGQPGPALS